MTFTKICLGMGIDQHTNFIVVNKNASSLYSRIADGNYRATALGHSTWKSLVGLQASLQFNCNKEGFNAVSGDPQIPKQESVSLQTKKMTAKPEIVELALAQEGSIMTPTLVGTELKHRSLQIMGKSTSKP